jgi:hypothetical protein
LKTGAIGDGDDQAFLKEVDIIDICTYDKEYRKELSGLYILVVTMAKH